MQPENKLNIGVAMTGSFCTVDTVLESIKEMISLGHDVTAILSYNLSSIDTRFGKAEDLRSALAEITGKPPLETLTDVEPIGPKKYFDALVVAPCTGSTLARLATGLSDTPVTLAVKSHLRRSLPIILGISTNDALGASMRNIAQLKNAKHVFFIPMGQDDHVNKPNSMIADFSMMMPAVYSAVNGIQIQPLL